MIRRYLLFGLFFLLLSACTSDKPSEISTEAKVYYTCAMHPQIREEDPGRCPICHMTLTAVKIDQSHKYHSPAVAAAESAQPLWYCKDYPDVHSLKSDPCPIDGTPMIQAGAAEGLEEKIAEVRLTEAQMTHFSPAVVPAARRELTSRVRLLGTVVQSEEGESFIPARVDGRVERVHVRSTGSFIQKGDPVVELYSPQLITGGEEYLLARRNHQEEKSADSRALLTQTTERLKLWGVQQYQLDNWFKQGTVPRNITLYSPASGIVRERIAVEGRYFQAGQNLFTLSDLSEVWVEMDVYERDTALVRHGQKVSLTFTALPGRIVDGTIDFINPFLDAKTRTLKVRTTISNPDGELKPGMVADATLNLEHSGESLVVPRTAVIDTGKRKVVWVQLAVNRYQAQVVRTGHEAEGFVEIKDGLSAGDQVVIEGGFLLDSQAQLFGGYEDQKTRPSQEHAH